MAEDIRNPIIQGVDGQQFIQTEQGLTPLDQQQIAPPQQQLGPESLLGAQPEQAPPPPQIQRPQDPRNLGNLRDRITPKSKLTPSEVIDQGTPDQLVQGVVTANGDALDETARNLQPKDIEKLSTKVGSTGLEAIIARYQKEAEAPLPGNKTSSFLGKLLKSFGAGLTGDQEKITRSIQEFDPNFVSDQDIAEAKKRRERAHNMVGKLISAKFKEDSKIADRAAIAKEGRLNREQDQTQFQAGQDFKKEKLGQGIKEIEAQSEADIKLENVKAFARAQENRNKRTEGQKKVDRALGTEVAKWISSGQNSSKDSIANVDGILERYQKRIDAGLKTTGSGRGRLFDSPSASTFLGVLDEDALSIKAAADELTVVNLKKTLGGQFAEREGREFKALGFDPNVGDKENIRRLRRKRELINQYITRMDKLGNILLTEGTVANSDILESSKPAKKRKEPTQKEKRDFLKGLQK